MSPTSMSTARSTRPSSASASPISRTKTCSSRTRLPRPTGTSRTRTRVRGRRNSTSVPSRKNSNALTLVCRPDNLAAAPMYRGSGGCSAGASRLVRCRLARANEGAGEFAVNVRCDLLRIEAGLCKQVRGIRNRVDTRRLYVNFGEAGARELCPVLGLFERSGDASDPEFDAAADFGGHFTAHDDVGYGKASARLQDAKRLGQNAILVGGEVDYAVGDDDVVRSFVFFFNFTSTTEKFDIVNAGLALVLAREIQHLVGHVE